MENPREDYSKNNANYNDSLLPQQRNEVKTFLNKEYDVSLRLLEKGLLRNQILKAWLERSIKDSHDR